MQNNYYIKPIEAFINCSNKNAIGGLSDFLIECFSRKKNTKKVKAPTLHYHLTITAPFCPILTYVHILNATKDAADKLVDFVLTKNTTSLSCVTLVPLKS